MKRVYVIVVMLLFGLPLATLSQTAEALSVTFHPRFGNAPMEAGKSFVLKPQDTVTIYRFKFYVSNIEWRDENGKTLLKDEGYYLIDMEDPASLQLQLKQPPGKVASMRFLLGVDSLRNVSGVQSGALDPLHGMFWTWNSGYVMAKLEGTSNRSVQAGKRFTYHVGGFRQHQAVQQWITLPAHGNDIHIAANAREWFVGKDPIDLAKEAVCHSPGAFAIKLSANYRTMFSLIDPQL